MCNFVHSHLDFPNRLNFVVVDSGALFEQAAVSYLQLDLQPAS
jgi:hypothetical protein